MIINSGKRVNFTCHDCGYNKSGPSGYTVRQAYDFLIKAQQKQSTRKQPGFAIKQRSKRRRRESLADQPEEKLENDPIIQQNAEEIRELAIQQELPRPLDRIVTDQEVLPVYYEKLERRDPPLGSEIDEFIKLTGLQKKLKDKGISQLYQYQEEVFKEIMNGNNLVISAPTGMGKTEAFLLPIIYSTIQMEPNPMKRKGPKALLIYPTKALARDQLGKIEYYTKSVGISVAKFDGDTSQTVRKQIYRNPPDILITNADMIHYHLMGNIQFQLMMKRIKYLVIDEIHLCVGSFGSNVLWIIRRLRRFSPYFQSIGASATISNAENFASTIFDVDVRLINLGTARRSDMHLTMLYPTTRSNLSVMADVTNSFASNKRKTLVFGNGHKSAEVINMILDEHGVKSNVHRAGLPNTHRHKAEEDFKENKIDALVSTPTLELGIDIGSLDSVVSMLTGLTSFVQRIGRAGRAGQESFATLVLRGDDPISAYYARNPKEYLSDLDPAFVEPDNPFVAKHQLLAMILDKPMDLEESSKYKDTIMELLRERLIKQDGKQIVPYNVKNIRKMLNDYSIRGIGNSVSIWYMNKQIGDRTLPMALSELHPNAIYLSGGRSYEVISYNDKLKTAKVSTTGSRHIRTQAMRDITPNIKRIFTETQINGLEAAYCELELTEEVHGYIKQNIFNNKVTGKYMLDTPISYTFNTMGFLIALPHPTDLVDHLPDKERQGRLGGTFHAIEHVLIESGNALSGGGSNQIGGLSMGDTGLVFVYDGSEGGSGLSRLLYDSLQKGLQRTLRIMEDCPCGRRDGCPRCTYSYQCGNNNQPLDRIGGINALKRFGKDNTELFYNFDGLESFIIEPEWDVQWTIQKARIAETINNLPY